MAATTRDAGAPREAALAAAVARLRQQRGELAAALKAHLHPDDGDAAAGLPRRGEETDDDAAAETQRERDLADLSRITGELSQVDAALARAAAGEFGDCLDCGEPIEIARLGVNPGALRCAECQQYAEQRATCARTRGAG